METSNSINIQMNWLTQKIVKFWFNRWYKKHPPESVNYWKKQDAQLAKVTHDATGGLQMEIKDEKYPFPGFPRGHILLGPLAKLKHTMKNMVFNQAFAELEKMANEMQADMLPPDKMAPAVKELNRVLELVENAEVTGDMKARIRLIRRVITFFLQEDDAYRFRWQWAMEHLDMKKVRLSKADKYYFRGKYFKVDHDRYDY